MNSTNSTKTTLREEVRKLAKKAFSMRLISGYGDGQYSDEYQIVYKGKPRHYPLERARFILSNLIATNQENQWSLD